MIFLPIVERELRAGSRRKATYWIRDATALAGLVFFIPALAIAAMGAGRAYAGAMVFNWMSWYGAVAGLLAGAFLGAEGIAAERRDGTLGFLFLTDLKGYDVVLGKFISASLNAFYCLLAFVPVLGLSVLVGGVTGGEFWRVSLTLVNMLFYSTALSILLSARLKSETRPTMIALLLLGGIWLGGAMLFYCSTVLSRPILAQCCYWTSLGSPGEAFSLATAARYLHQHASFWRSLIISHLLGWGFLGLAAWRLDSSVTSRGDPSADYFGRRRRIASLLDVNPIVWLMDDSRRLRNVVRGLGICGALGALLSHEIYTLWPVCFCLKILFAIQSCRFFAEGRRNGALELLGATPITGKELIAGQWAALRRIFLVPVCLVLAANIVASAWEVQLNPWEWGPLGVFALYQVATQALDFLAIGWCGMWIALRLRQPSRAVWVTVLVAILLPLGLFCIPNAAIDLLILAVAQNRISEWYNPRLRGWRDKARDERAMV